MKWLYYSLITIILISVSSCKQDFDITSKYKETPVVYGLLNWTETTHYIRIQKAYLIDGNAQIAAGISDSIYYPANALTVKLTPYFNGSPSGSPFTLTRVNGNDIGLPKQTGAFASDSNILYTFNGTLSPDKTYKLEITNNESGNKIYSETAMVKDFAVTQPRKVYVDADKIPLQNNNPRKIIIAPTNNGNAAIYDAKIRFYYKEYRQSDDALLRDTSIDIILLQSYLPGSSTNNITADLSATNVIGFLADHLTHDNTIYRVFNIEKGIQVFVSAGGTEMANYLTSQIVQSGLASNEALPIYTNINGGLGLFSSRYTKEVDSVLISDTGLDSLACSTFSSGLRFKGHSGQICE